MKKAIPF